MDLINLQQEANNIPYEEVDPATYDSVVMDTDAADQKKKKLPMLILGGSWSRLIFSPVSRGQAGHNRCLSINQTRWLGGFV